MLTDLLKAAEGGREAVLGTLNCVRQLLLYLDTTDNSPVSVDCLIEVIIPIALNKLKNSDFLQIHAEKCNLSVK